MESFLDRELFGIAVTDGLRALAIAAAIFVLLSALRGFLVARLGTGEAGKAPTLRHLVGGLVGRTWWLFLLIVAVYAGAQVLPLPDGVARLVRSVTLVACFIQAGLWFSQLVVQWLARFAARREREGRPVRNALSLIQFLARILVWTVALLLILDNLGVDITALVAGLGIGGIAIGLAAQNILGDLFASLSIVLDKPFVPGDYIVFDDIEGTVERVGLKTTRIRSLSGEQIVCANADLLSTRIRNFKRMLERRISFSLGVVYQTPPETLERIPAIIEEAIEAQDQVRFERAHFASFGESALNFQVVYWMLNPDYALFMDRQQAINLAIFRRFAEAGIDFAYPTQTLFLERPAPPATD